MPSPSLFNPPAGQLHVRCDSKDVLRHGLPVAPCIHTLKAARPTRRTASALDNVIQVRRPATSPPSTTLPRAPPERARDKKFESCALALAPAVAAAPAPRPARQQTWPCR
ncbi:hypothetical protein VFPFJ_04433 [Purpureocillium lilacinum]|uniref:Uncharacterized protein n=1 Tax=Purpureocillium lilacinum TaxID=33203 RepID=A0A179HJU5_PURLI|nr:hypothetical protein VFPFJ_04433 [Purpureocillium lilacinum]OAQ90274.1 hypothetical protein VFPFJ_04433 [Purpureocillium lilacinum]